MLVSGTADAAAVPEPIQNLLEAAADRTDSMLEMHRIPAAVELFVVPRSPVVVGLEVHRSPVVLENLVADPSSDRLAADWDIQLRKADSLVDFDN